MEKISYKPCLLLEHARGRSMFVSPSPGLWIRYEIEQHQSRWFLIMFFYCEILQLIHKPVFPHWVSPFVFPSRRSSKLLPFQIRWVELTGAREGAWLLQHGPRSLPQLSDGEHWAKTWPRYKANLYKSRTTLLKTLNFKNNLRDIKNTEAKEAALVSLETSLMNG